MFGRLATAYGYTPAEIREMTLADVEMLSRSWQRQPPVCDLVHALAIWAGAVKPPAASPQSRERPSLADVKNLIGET